VTSGNRHVGEVTDGGPAGGVRHTPLVRDSDFPGRPVTRSDRWVDVVLGSWLVLAGALALTAQLRLIPGPFTGRHAWNDAHYSVIARNFATHGIIGLGGMLMQNNPPWSAAEADIYTHWPPLFPMLLGLTFRLLGASEASARMMMLALVMLCGTALYLVCRAVLGRRSAMISMLAFLGLPIIYHDAAHLLPEYLSISFFLMGLAAFLKASDGNEKWMTVAMVAMVLAIATSWEPLLALPGLLVAVFWTRDPSMFRRACALSVAGLMTAVTVAAMYLFQKPRFVGDLLYTLLVRSGIEASALQPVDLYAIANRQEYASYPKPRLANLVLIPWTRLHLVGGVLFLVSLGWWAIRARSRREVLLAGASLTSLWVMWFIFVSNHAQAHEFQMLLALPIAAFCIGLLGGDITVALDKRVTRSRWRLLRVGVVLLGPLWLLAPLISDWVYPDPPRQADGLVQMGVRIGQHTDTESVVLTPIRDMVPVYYSGRHTIRGIEDDAALALSSRRVRELFPRAKLFLALPADQFARERFPDALRRFRSTFTDGVLVLIRLDEAS